MRSLRTVSLLIIVMLAAACGDDAAPDAGPADAQIARDGGVVTFSCGVLACVDGEDFCRVTPTAACAPVDGGGCPAPQEACRTTAGASGCWPAPERRCEPLPPGCARCACLTGTACGSVQASCTSAPGRGITLTCPP